MKKLLLGVACLLIVGIVQYQAQGSVGYTLDVTTFYQFGGPGDLVAGGSGAPDTGFFRVTNNGSSDFSGILSLLAVSGLTGDHSIASGPITLLPGQSASITDTSSESSNQGGYGGPFSGPQIGATLSIIGTISLGLGSEPVSLSVSDMDIHSGVPRTNPFGDTLDNYVFQGGDSIGRDTGDDYETTQAPGNFRFFEPADTNGAVPEPTTIVVWSFVGLFSLVVGKMRPSRVF